MAAATARRAAHGISGAVHSRSVASATDAPAGRPTPGGARYSSRDASDGTGKRPPLGGTAAGRRGRRARGRVAVDKDAGGGGGAGSSSRTRPRDGSGGRRIRGRDPAKGCG